MFLNLIFSLIVLEAVRIAWRIKKDKGGEE